MPYVNNPLLPDTDPTGQYGYGQYGAAPTLTPTSPLATPWGGATGKVTIPGYTPDYEGILANRPGLMAVKSAGQFSLTKAAAYRDAALKTLQRYFKNTMGNLTRTREQSDLLSTVGLAARGALDSGERPWDVEQITRTYDQGKFMAEGDLARDTASAVNSYLDTLERARSDEAQAYNDAYGDLIQDPLYRPTQPTEATLVENWSEKYGKPVYQDGMGRLWIVGEDGNPIIFNPGS